MAFDFSLCFRKGDVGGERGFEAALADLAFCAAASAFEGERRKTNINIHNTTPIMMVSGFDRRSDRVGPMARGTVGRPQLMMFGVGSISQEDICSSCFVGAFEWVYSSSIGVAGAVE